MNKKNKEETKEKIRTILENKELSTREIMLKLKEIDIYISKDSLHRLLKKTDEIVCKKVPLGTGFKYLWSVEKKEENSLKENLEKDFFECQQSLKETESKLEEIKDKFYDLLDKRDYLEIRIRVLKDILNLT